MKFICETNFKDYVEPITSGALTAADSAKLWRNFEPILRRSVDKLVLKERSRLAACDDLPFCGKYLLVAAYLASYNSVKSDKRFFVKYQGHNRTRKLKMSRNEKMIAGPKPFTLERLLHVYQALLELNCGFSADDESSKSYLAPNAQLLSDVRNLASLRLLVPLNQSTASGLSSATKWRVSEALTLDYMQIVAKSVRFDLMSHLEQFAYKQ